MPLTILSLVAKQSICLATSHGCSLNHKLHDILSSTGHWVGVPRQILSILPTCTFYEGHFGKKASVELPALKVPSNFSDHIKLKFMVMCTYNFHHQSRNHVWNKKSSYYRFWYATTHVKLPIV